MQAQIKQFLHEEKGIGALKHVRVNRYGVRGPIGKRIEPLPKDPDIDFNLWLGPAADKPVFRNAWHYDWHWDWNTGSGEMGNWGVHVLDDVRNVVFRDSVAVPRRIIGGGGRVVWDVMSSFLCGISSKALDRRTACQPVLEKTGWQPVLRGG